MGGVLAWERFFLRTQHRLTSLASYNDPYDFPGVYKYLKIVSNPQRFQVYVTNEIVMTVLL